MHKWVALLTLVVCTSASASVPVSQRDALLGLYAGTNGDGWTNRTGWKGPAGSECTWYGVQCDEAGSSVVELNLYNNNLTGSLPPEIGNFPALRVLFLFDNPIGGTIPSAIGQLTSLEALILDRTNIGGTIPPSIGALSRLRDLEIGGTKVSGAIPREIGQLAALEELHLDGNDLSGTIPPEIGQLRNLTDLDLVDNGFTGEIPKEIGALSSLRSLDLALNRLSGPIPPDLGRLTNLMRLSLGVNALSGEIPPQVGALKNLEELRLDRNALRGAVPKAIGDLGALLTLDLTTNQLEGAFPADILRLVRLRELRLGDNRFTGELPRAIGALKELELFSAGGNAFSGSIPVELTTLTRLTGVELFGNRLSGEIPRNIGDLTALDYVDLSGNELTGTIPSSIGRLVSLRYLYAYTNKLEGSIPGELGALGKLEQLYIGDNRLTGSIPDALRNLHELTALGLAGNGIDGPLPVWIGELTKLDRLDLSYTRISGPIPPQIGLLTNLRDLALNDAQLSGRLPAELGSMRALETFHAEFNQLTGPIPPQIGQLTNLEWLSLDFNELSGTLPREIGSLRQLYWLTLIGNALEGTLPAEIAGLAKLRFLWLDGNLFSGPLPPVLGKLTSLEELSVSSNGFRGEIPAELKTLTALTDKRSDFNYNALVTSDASLRDFLNRKQYDGAWEKTQTVTPANLKVNEITDRSATLQWDLIPFVEGEGGYQVVASATAGGPPVAVATTSWKDDGSIIVRGLSAATAYVFDVRTVTHPHGLQRQLLVSDPSSPVAATTGPRVLAPAEVIVVEPAGGLVEVDGVAKNDDTFTLTNYGDAATDLTVAVGEGDFFTISPTSLTLAGGASRTITIRSIPRPVGTYYGYVLITGEGTNGGIGVGIALLSVARPAGTVLAQAVSTRIETAGVPGSDSVGSAKFRNIGTATLSGIVISDAPWVQPATDPITIDPQQTATVNFRIVRSKRPPGVGALAANLSLVYVDGAPPSGLGHPLDNTTGGVSVTRVTVVDVTKPPVAPGTPPPAIPGEVALFAPGITALQRSGAFVTSDLSVVNSSGARPLSDLRIFFTPAGNAGGSSVATMQSIGSTQGVSLVNVVGNVYGAADTVGTLQLRSADAEEIAAFAKLVTTRASSVTLSDIPLFRSDRSAGASQAIYLAGVRAGADLFLQETSGSAATVRVDYLDAAGNPAGSRTEPVPAFALVELRGAVPDSAVTSVVTTLAGSAGRIAAYARVTDPASGDSWSVVDWARVNGYSLAGAVRIPFTEEKVAGSGGGARRRAAPHADPSRAATDATIFNPGAVDTRATMRVIDAGGRISEREIVVAARRTVTLSDVASPAPTASITIDPTSRGQLVVTSRSYRLANGTVGSAVPVVGASSGLRVGQSQIFGDLDDSTSATVAAAGSSTFRTSYGFVETAGESVTVRASVVITETKSITSAVLSRTFDLAPRQQIVLEELVRSIAGSSRDTAYSDLHGLQLRIEVTGGKGAIVPFVIVTDNGSGDSVVRLE